MKYTATVEYDDATGEYFVVFPPAFLDKIGWREGDTLEWTVEEDRLILQCVTKK